MSTIPLPALAVQQQPGVLDQYSKVMQLKSLMGQQALLPGQLQQQQQQIQNSATQNQLGQQELEKGSMAIAATTALNKSYQNAVKVGSDGIPQIDPQAISDSLRSAGQGSQIPGVLENLNKYNKSMLDIQTAKADLQAKGNDIMGAAAAAVKAANYNPQLAHTIVDTLPQTPQTDAFRAKIDDPVALKQIVDQAIAGSPKQQELANAKTTADARKQQADTDAERLTQEENPNSPLNVAKVSLAGQEAQAKLPSEEAIAKVREEVTQQFQNNKDAKDKIESNVLKPYQDKMASVNELQSALNQAQQGNVTAARGVLLKLIGVTNPDGTKRYNEAEANRLLSQGNIPTKLQSSLQNALTGNNWTPQVINDMKSFADAQGQVAAQTLNNGIDNTNKLYGSQVGQGLKAGGAQGGGPASNAAPPANVTKALAGVGVGRHTLSDGSVWDKTSDGGVTRIK